MLCKKCKTAVFDNAVICPYCKSKINPHAKKIKVSLSAVAVVIISILIAVPIVRNYKNESNAVQNEPQTAVVPTPSEIVMATPQPAPSFEAIESTHQPTPTFVPNFEKTHEEVRDLIEDVAKAAQLYYDKYNQQTDFVSKNGFLYEFSTKEYLQPGLLWDVTNMNPDYKEEDVLILYIKPEDLRQYSQLKIGQGRELEIFTAYETNDGFMICSTASEGGLIYREDLKSVLDKYNCNNGDIIRYTADSSQAEAILSALRKHTNEVNGFNVRYMAGDDLFAVAVVSPKTDNVSINQYVLKYEHGEYSVKISNYEKEWKFRNMVSQKLPNMDSAIMPRYNLFTDAKYIRGDFTKVDEALRRQGLVTDLTGQLSFTSGNDEFVYMEYTSGAKYLGNYDENSYTWVMYAIADYKECEDIMKIKSKFVQPPYYLLKQF